MASISPQHVQPLTAGFLGLIVGTLVIIALLNVAANH